MRQPKFYTPTFASAAQDYADTWLVGGPCTDTGRGIVLSYFVDPKFNAWTGKPVDEITPGDVTLLVDRLRGVDERIARIGFEKLASLFHWALVRGHHHVSDDPTARLPRLAAELGVNLPFLSLTEMRLYLGAVARIDDFGERSFCEALALTGFYPTDLALMRWRQLDLSQSFWLHPRTNTKLPLSFYFVSQLIALRTHRIGTDDHVFSIGGRPVTATALAGARTRLVKYLVYTTAPPQTVRNLTFEDVSRTVFLHLREIGLQKETAKIVTGQKAPPRLWGDRSQSFLHDVVARHSETLMRLTEAR